MNDVNLDDLKIDHKPVRQGRRFPYSIVIVFFLLGMGLAFALIYLNPSLFSDITGVELTRDASTDAETPDPGSGRAPPGPGDGGGQSTPPPAESFTEGGWVEVPSYHPVVVSALIPGRLDELKVLEGSKVAKGDVIGALYQKDLEDEVDKAAADLKVAEADLSRLKAGFRVQEVEQARAELEAAEADLDLREAVLNRTRELVETGAVSQEDLDRDEAAYRVAKAKLQRLGQDLSLKKEGYRVEDIQAAEAEVGKRRALLELARNRLEYAVIKSPIDGAVLERFVTPGTYIPANDPRVVSLYDPNDLQVRVDVRQEHIAGVHIGQQVEVFTDVDPNRSYAGEVIRIDPMADFKKNTIQVKIKLLETSEQLHPEMIARIRFMRKKDDQDHGKS